MDLFLCLLVCTCVLNRNRTTLLLNFQEYLNRLTYFDIYLKSSKTPTIYVADVTLTFNEMFRWIFSGLNVNVSQCSIDSVHITVKSNDTEQLFVETATIMIHNSSFGSLDLNPRSKAQITLCHIDGQLIPRPHLITANNSNVSIENCQFENFINKNDSTILFGHNYSNVIIENSVFIQNNSSKGVLLLRNNSSLRISSSTISQNIAFSLSYSAITLFEGIQAVVSSTVFMNNSALTGGAMNIQHKCQITLTNCTFSSNKAIAGKTLSIQNNPTVKMAAPATDKNNIETVTRINPVLFNETLLQGDETGVLTAHRVPLLVRSFILKEKSEQQEGYVPGVAGAVYVAVQSNLIVTNCVFENNSANDSGGAVDAKFNVRLDVQGTKFVGNKASVDGGAIDSQQKVHLQITNCVFEENISEQLGGAINNEENSVLCVQETHFVGNRALQGGSIGVGIGSHLHMKRCTFKDDYAQDLGGSIVAGIDAVLEIDMSHFLNDTAFCGGAILVTSNSTLNVQETIFVGNKALSDSGAIFVQSQTHLQITHCVFEENIAERLGGAIVGGNNVTVVVADTNFKSNSAWQGGAIDVNMQAYLQATNCTFKYNYAEKLGGAFFGGLDLFCEINGSYFLKNSASQGGAINVQQDASVFITNSELEHNFAGDVGGAILAAFNATLILQEVSFTLNSASDEAGALFLLVSECDVVWCIFHNNTAKTAGGAVFMQSQSSLKIDNTDFTNNNSSSGGAIEIDENSTLEVNMCRYWKNVAKQSGGAIQLKGYSTVVIENCHFLSNHATSGGAVNLNSPKHVSLQGTLLLRNVASNRGGAVAISDGSFIIINNITCIGNQSPRGGCLQIEGVTLTLNNSEISDNFGLQYASGIAAYYSGIQVGSWLFRYYVI